MTYTYKTNGVCSQSITFDIEEGKVKNVKYSGGCNGNLKGISALVEGLSVDQVIEKLSGIRCGFKSTSCPDQLALALSQYKAEEGE